MVFDLMRYKAEADPLHNKQGKDKIQALSATEFRLRRSCWHLLLFSREVALPERPQQNSQRFRHRQIPDRLTLRYGGAGVRQLALQQRTGSFYPARAEKGEYRCSYSSTTTACSNPMRFIATASAELCSRRP